MAAWQQQAAGKPHPAGAAPPSPVPPPPQGADIDNRLPLYGSIVLSGGTTMFAGLASRLEKELRSLYLDRRGGRG